MLLDAYISPNQVGVPGTLIGEYILILENLISSLYLVVLLLLCKGRIVEQICYILHKPNSGCLITK